MKLRIAALIAMAAAILAIIAYLRDWRSSLAGDGAASQPAVVLEKANPVLPPQPIPDGGTKLPPALPAPQPPQAKLPGIAAAAPSPRVSGGAAPAPARASIPTVNPTSFRARTSPGDPLAADAERSAGAIDADKVSLMLRDYRTRMGENPVGTNAEIMKAIMGGNPKGAMLGPPDGLQVNGDGELVDRWGTPYFFHQLSRTSMEIRSAGPDRKMYTEDDVIAH